MRLGLITIVLLLQISCSSNIGNDIKTGFRALSPIDRPDKSELNVLIAKIVEEMLANNEFVGKQNPIAVTSIANIKDLDSTNRLGYQLSEGIAHYLHENGFRVVDFKLTGNIQITDKGNFAETRNWKKLNKQLAIDYIVTGSIDYFGDGLNITVRMVGAQSSIIVASSQAYITKEVYKDLMPGNDHYTAALESDNTSENGNVLLPQLMNNTQDTQAMIDASITKAMQENMNDEHRVKTINGQLYRKSQL